jgi:hypothetical protein
MGSGIHSREAACGPSDRCLRGGGCGHVDPVPPLSGMTRRGTCSSFRCGGQSPGMSGMSGISGCAAESLLHVKVQPIGSQMVDPYSVQELPKLFSDLGRDLLSERGLDSTLGLVSARASRSRAATTDETLGVMLATGASLVRTSARLHDDVAHLQRALRSNRASALRSVC